MDAAEQQPAQRPARGGSGGGNGGVGKAAYPESITRLIDELARLPGIGRRSAERLSFHLLKAKEPEAMALSRAIADVKLRVRHCSVCYNLMDAAPGPPPGGESGPT